MRVIISATALSLLLLPSLASSAILTMSGACTVPSGIGCGVYQEQGFQVVDSPILFGFPDFGLGFGGIAVFSDLTQGVRVSRIDGQPFDLLQAFVSPYCCGTAPTEFTEFRSSKGGFLTANMGTTMFSGDAWLGITFFDWGLTFADFDQTAFIKGAVLDNVVVPEPSLTALLFLGLAEVGRRGRRRIRPGLR